MTLSNEEKAALGGYVTELRRAFHRRPELSLREHGTAARIEAELDALGIPHRRVGETGVLGTVRGGRPGDMAAALRADIDALPIQEENDVPYRSEADGVMHACGHDAHAACLLGAARLLAARRVTASTFLKLALVSLFLFLARLFELFLALFNFLIGLLLAFG